MNIIIKEKSTSIDLPEKVAGLQTKGNN